MSLEITDRYEERHLGPGSDDVSRMLEVIGVGSIEQLIDETIPASIRSPQPLKLDPSMSEFEFLEHVRKLAAKNKLHTSYIGLGYHDSITPSVIVRNILENPGWYTQYTPYQAEISQGRLEALLNFQQMVIDLTGMDIANASLLDEATAAAEGMTVLHRMRPGAVSARNADTFFVSNQVLPHTIEVLQSRAEPLGIEVEVGDTDDFDPTREDVFGLLLQYPGEDGSVSDYSPLIEGAHANDVRVVVAADILSLLLLKTPGDMGADVVVGSTQRFGVPMGFGGPHAAYFATRDDFKRSMPGRLIGVSVDREGRTAYRLALQTREQHIRREKATSNICTAQALLAIMASMYAVYHGPHGLQKIAGRVHRMARVVDTALTTLGYTQKNKVYFDTLRVEVGADRMEALKSAALKRTINLRYYDESQVTIAFDEAKTEKDLVELVAAFAEVADKDVPPLETESGKAILPDDLKRSGDFLTHPVFRAHHSETKMMRYLKSLENCDLALNRAMIPLGSCTMKLNPASSMLPLTLPELGRMHPFAPANQTQGYRELFASLEKDLAEITGFAATSLQPNSGAQGEFAGLMVIRRYHTERGDKERDVALIPVSAHGTNPASATMAGMSVVFVKCDDQGNVDLEDLRSKCEANRERLSCLMITYPSTHGVFEESIREVCKSVHDHGGQVYMDGANMNAQVGYTSPGEIGADVCHLNLHKTFSIPHGGGGPGMGPICVAKHLADYLPTHSLSERVGGEQGIPPVAAAPWGSASILVISYAYIKMLGAGGVKEATRYAILNANYLKSRLEKDYRVLYQGSQGRIAHEMIIDVRPFKSDGIEVEDIAKRLIDYGFHAPTMSWPVAGTLMVEPTESEPLFELDRFCEAMLAIRQEIRDVVDGRVEIAKSPLRLAPHTADEISRADWPYDYTRETAVFPGGAARAHKYWPPVSRIDNVYGDRNLFCACPPLEAYSEDAPAVAGAK